MVFSLLVLLLLLVSFGRHPLPAGRGHDGQLHTGVQRAGPLGRLLDARPALAHPQDRPAQPAQALHLRALPGEGQPGPAG